MTLTMLCFVVFIMRIFAPVLAKISTYVFVKLLRSKLSSASLHTDGSITNNIITVTHKLLLLGQLSLIKNEA